MSRRRSRETRTRYLHFPMIAGIVLFAFGVKKTLEGVYEPLDPMPAAFALCGGVAIYLAGHIALPLPQRRHPEPSPHGRRHRVSWR